MGYFFVFKRVKISLLQRNAILTFFLSFSVSDENNSCNTVPHFPRHPFMTKPQSALFLPPDCSPDTNFPSVPCCPQLPPQASASVPPAKGDDGTILKWIFTVNIIEKEFHYHSRENFLREQEK